MQVRRVTEKTQLKKKKTTEVTMHQKEKGKTDSSLIKAAAECDSDKHSGTADQRRPPFDWPASQHENRLDETQKQHTASFPSNSLCNQFSSSASPFLLWEPAFVSKSFSTAILKRVSGKHLITFGTPNARISFNHLSCR